MDFAVSVTTNRTSTPSRFTLPGTTMPPMRNVRPTGASLAATCDGVKKNTRFLLNAVSTRAVATPRATTPRAIHAMRLCLGFTFSLHQHHDFDRQQTERHAIGAPDVKRVSAHGEELAHVFCPPDKGGGAERRGVCAAKTNPIFIASPRSRNARA